MFHISLNNNSGWLLLMRQRSKTFLVEVTPSQSRPRKYGTTVEAAVMILEDVNNWGGVLQINILKKSQTLKNNHPPLEWLVSWQMFDRNSGGKTSQIEWFSESNLRSFWLLLVLYSALAFSGSQLQRQLAYKTWLGTSGPDCHLTSKIGLLQKNQKLHLNPRYDPGYLYLAFCFWKKFLCLDSNQNQ